MKEQLKEAAPKWLRNLWYPGKTTGRVAQGALISAADDVHDVAVDIRKFITEEAKPTAENLRRTSYRARRNIDRLPAMMFGGAIVAGTTGGVAAGTVSPVISSYLEKRKALGKGKMEKKAEVFFEGFNKVLGDLDGK